MSRCTDFYNKLNYNHFIDLRTRIYIGCWMSSNIGFISANALRMFYYLFIEGIKVNVSVISELVHYWCIDNQTCAQY